MIIILINYIIVFKPDDISFFINFNNSIDFDRFGLVKFGNGSSIDSLLE